MTYDWLSLDFVYYPVSGILWFWHKALSWIFGPDSGFSWAFSVVLLVFTIRLALIPAMVRSVRATRQMRELQPQIRALQKKFGTDRQRLAVEMQKLQHEHGFNPLMGCLPMFVQIPIFVGLYHVIHSFNRTGTGRTELGLDFLTNANTPNYFFSATDVQSFLQARLFGVPLSVSIRSSSNQLQAFGPFGGVPDRTSIVVLAVTLMVASAALTHVNARASIVRLGSAAATDPQTAMTNKLALYVFPLGILVSGAFFHVAVLIYFVSNNLWTFMQNKYVWSVVAPVREWLPHNAIADLKPTERSAGAEERAARHESLASRKVDSAHHRQAFAHYMAAGDACAGYLGSGSTRALAYYLWAADVARCRSQKKSYQAAIAKVEAHVRPVLQNRATTLTVNRAFVTQYLFVTIAAAREFGDKGAAARIAHSHLGWLRGLYGVADTVPTASQLQYARPEFRSLGFVAAFAIPEPSATQRERLQAAEFVAAMGVQMVAIGKRAGDSTFTQNGQELLTTVSQTTRESSGGSALMDTAKGFAMDYAKDEFQDVAFDLIAPYIHDAVQAGFNGAVATVDGVRSLF